MNGALFALVNSENPDQVFAWGMEVTVAEDPEAGTATRAAVVYRPAFGSEQEVLGTHASAEAACALYGRIAPLELEWDADVWYTAFGDLRT